MKLKIKVLNRELGAESDHRQVRLPYPEDLKAAIDQYMTLGQGVVVYHNSFFDYKYDTKLNNYHNVDSISVAGHVIESVVEDNQVYVYIDLNEEINKDESYLCFYRATMQSDPQMPDHTLKITNLFSIDLIHIEQKEIETDHINPPTFEIIE